MYDDLETLEALGETLYDSGNLELSAEIFRSLIDKDSNNSAAKIMLADILNEDGDADSALLLLDEISTKDDKYTAVLMQKADIYQTLGMEEVSESILDEALKRNPKKQPLIFGMAELLYSEGKYGEASVYYLKLIKSGVTNYLNQNVQVRYACCLTFTGYFEKASQIFERFNDLLLHDDELFSKGLVFFELHEVKKAAGAIKTLIERSPDYAPAYLVLAKSYEELNQLELAYETAQKGCALDEFDMRMRMEFSHLAYKLGHIQQAIDSYESILVKDPENIEALSELSKIKFSMGLNDEVIDLLVNKESLDPVLAWNLGKSYLEEDQLDLAKDSLISVFNDFQNNPEYLLDLISLFRRDYQIKTLISVMQLYLKIVPSDDTIASEYEELRNEQKLDD